MTTIPCFTDDCIFTSHRLDDLLLQGNKLCDFLPGLKLSEFHKKDNISGRQVLARWIEFFKSKDTPFLVNIRNGRAILWKIDERLRDYQIKKEREKPGVNWFRESSREISREDLLEQFDKFEKGDIYNV